MSAGKRFLPLSLTPCSGGGRPVKIVQCAGRVKGATGYEVRIYVNGELALTTTVTLPAGSTVHSCGFPGTSELGTYEDDSWKVRASNGAGNGPWSKTLHFTVH